MDLTRRTLLAAAAAAPAAFAGARLARALTPQQELIEKCRLTFEKLITSVEFGETPFRLNSVGLTMRLPAGAVAQITGSGDRAAAQDVRSVYLSLAVKRYIVDLTSQTRQNNDVYLGASPRGSLGLARASQAHAALDGRSHVLPDDVKALAPAVLAHRIIVNPSARLREVTPERIVQEILTAVPVPGGSFIT